MKRSILVLLALTVGCVTGAAVRDIVVPALAQGQVGPNYEYDMALVSERNLDDVVKHKQILSKYGREGWRLVATTQFGNSADSYLYFERQLPR